MLISTIHVFYLYLSDDRDCNRIPELIQSSMDYYVFAQVTLNYSS